MIIGLEELNKRILNIISAMPDEIENALIGDANDVILPLAQSRCPVKTGELRDSGSVGTPEYDGHEVIVPIGFSASYAVFVHENLEARHPNGGQAKFLESALNDTASGAITRIGNRIKLERLV